MNEWLLNSARMNNTRTIPPDGDELPSDMMARLQLTTTEQEISGADSLTTQPPNARGGGEDELQKADSYVAESATQDGFICGISPFSQPTNLLQAHAHEEEEENGNEQTAAAAAASEALQAIQNSVAANGASQQEGSRTKPEIMISESGSKEPEEGAVGEEEDEESSEISASDEDGSWIAWFCSLRGNEFFCEVDEDYIQVRVRRLGFHEASQAGDQSAPARLHAHQLPRPFDQRVTHPYL